MKNKTKITVVGSGYVGMSLAVLLSQCNEVILLDIDTSRIEKVKKKQSTVRDKEIEDFLTKKNLGLKFNLKYIYLFHLSSPSNQKS